MSLFDLAKDALKEIPMADVMRARLELAFDQSALQERQISTLRDENAELKAELKIANRDIEKKQKELTEIKDFHKEEVRIHRSIEFRKGVRTGSVWQAFCPRCHCPAVALQSDWFIACSDRKCEWQSAAPGSMLGTLLNELPK